MSNILQTGLIIGAAVAISQQINAHAEEDILKELKDSLAKDPKFIAKLNSLITGQPGQKGDKGDQGEPGEAFEFEDFTPEQIEAIVSQAADLVKADRYINRVPTILTPQDDSTTLYPGGVYTLKPTDTDLIIYDPWITLVKLDPTDRVARNVHFLNRKLNQVAFVVKDHEENANTAISAPIGSSRQFWVKDGKFL